MTKISVAFMTKRPGGMDVAKYGLLRQTFKDYELLLVDELYEKRHDAVESYFQGSGIDLVHINASKEGHPKWTLWDWTVGRSRNLALAYASGELLMILDDYCVYSPTALEATWKAWETWGKQGVVVILAPSASHGLAFKHPFLKYCSERKGTWSRQGGSSFLDAPPDTYISIYSQDFGEKPSLRKTSDDPRIPSTRIDGTMRDPRPDDPPKFRAIDAGTAGRFRYWTMGAGAAWGLTAPVEDAVKINGWNNSLDGRWGGWEEINLRLWYAFNHRYLATKDALMYQLPHTFDIVGWGIRHHGKSNKGRPHPETFPYGKVLAKAKAGDCWADNPFNLEEERRKVRETGKTDIFNH